MQYFSAPSSQIIMATPDSKIAELEEQIKETKAERVRLKAAKDPAWEKMLELELELRKELTAAMQKENFLLQAQQGEKDQLPEQSALSAAYICSFSPLILDVLLAWSGGGFYLLPHCLCLFS